MSITSQVRFDPDRARAEQGVQRFEQRLIEAISHDGDWTAAFTDRSGQLLRLLDAVGAVLTHDGEILKVGTTPTDAEVNELVDWLTRQQPDSMYYTRAIGLEQPQFESIAALTPGVMSCPVSNVAGEYLIWFRPERVETICWGGQPDKPVGGELSPRTSFAKWTEELKNTSDSWGETAVSVASLMRTAVGRSARPAAPIRFAAIFRRKGICHAKPEVIAADTTIMAWQRHSR